jgi:hypothetical protein
MSLANRVVFLKRFLENSKGVLQSRLLMEEGNLQRESEVIYVILRKCFNLLGLFQNLTAVLHRRCQSFRASTKKMNTFPMPSIKDPGIAKKYKAKFSFVAGILGG